MHVFTPIKKIPRPTTMNDTIYPLARYMEGCTYCRYISSVHVHIGGIYLTCPGSERRYLPDSNKPGTFNLLGSLKVGPSVPNEGEGERERQREREGGRDDLPRLGASFVHPSILTDRQTRWERMFRRTCNLGMKMYKRV